MSAPSVNHLKSLYRRLLRELPHRQPNILANPSPIQRHIRSQFSSTAHSPPDPGHEAAAVDQFVQYLKAQRLYLTLVERYNPGMNMSEEDRVRLTARRVGMDLPPELLGSMGGGDGGKGGQN